MLRIVILTALLLTGALALAPEAAAACEPGTNPNYCVGHVRRFVTEGVDEVREAAEDVCKPESC